MKKQTDDMLVLMPSYMSEVLHVLLQQQRFLYLQVPP